MKNADSQTTVELEIIMGGDPPAVIRVDGLYFSYGGPVKTLATGADLSWPRAVTINDIAYWRER